MVALSSTQTFLRYPGGCISCSSTSDASYKHDIPPSKNSQLVWNWNLDSAPSQDSPANSPHESFPRSRKSENRTFSQTTSTKDSPQEKNSKTAVGCACLISAVNYNLLAYFLIANLLTGAVNLSIETINASPTSSFIIMNIYLLVLHAMITLLYRRKILLKL